MASADLDELVFVLDVTLLTKKGFVGTTSYRGKAVELEFDDGDAGVFLSSEMAARLKVRKGSRVLLTTENERHQVSEAVVSGVGRTLRVSNPKVYYEIGREGGAILKIRKA